MRTPADTTRAAVGDPPSPAGEGGRHVVKVAAAQIACRPGDVAANLTLHLETIEEARRLGVGLLVFPELSLTDYESHPEAGRLARPADAPELRALAEAAREMVVVAGFIERGEGGRAFNAAAFLSGGRVLHVHRKLNLPTYGGLVEGLHYGAGAEIGLAATPLGATACLVCADTWNPALPWLAALRGAEALVVPVASARGAVAAEFDSRDGWGINLRHNAMTYGLPTVMTNHSGCRGGLDFWGGSTIVDAFGRIVARAGEGPELLVAELDTTDGDRARERLPTMRDATPDLVGSLLGSPAPGAPGPGGPAR